MDNFLQQLNRHPRQVEAIARDVDEYILTHHDWEYEIASIPVLHICGVYMTASPSLPSSEQVWAAFCLQPTPRLFDMITFNAATCSATLVLYWEGLRRQYDNASDRNKAFHKILNGMDERELSIQFPLEPEWQENDILAWKRQLRSKFPSPFDVALALRWHSLANCKEFCELMYRMPASNDRIRLIMGATSSTLLLSFTVCNHGTFFSTLNADEKVAFFETACLDPAVDATLLMGFLRPQVGLRFATTIALVCHEWLSSKMMYSLMEDVQKALHIIPRVPKKRTVNNVLERLQILCREMKRLHVFARMGAGYVYDHIETTRLDSAHDQLAKKLDAFEFHENVLLSFTTPVRPTETYWSRVAPQSQLDRFFRKYLVTYTLEMFTRTEAVVDQVLEVYYDADRNPSIDIHMMYNLGKRKKM